MKRPCSVCTRRRALHPSGLCYECWGQHRREVVEQTEREKAADYRRGLREFAKRSGASHRETEGGASAATAVATPPAPGPHAVFAGDPEERIDEMAEEYRRVWAGFA